MGGLSQGGINRCQDSSKGFHGAASLEIDVADLAICVVERPVELFVSVWV